LRLRARDRSTLTHGESAHRVIFTHLPDSRNWVRFINSPPPPQPPEKPREPPTRTRPHPPRPTPKTTSHSNPPTSPTPHGPTSREPRSTPRSPPSTSSIGSHHSGKTAYSTQKMRDHLSAPLNALRVRAQNSVFSVYQNRKTSKKRMQHRRSESQAAPRARPSRTLNTSTAYASDNNPGSKQGDPPSA
jgi:hypothetical protein